MNGEPIVPPIEPPELREARMERYAFDHGIPLTVLDEQPTSRLLAMFAMTDALRG